MRREPATRLLNVADMDPFLETERLLLRRLTPAEVDNLYALDSDPEVMRFLNGGEPTPYDVIRDQVLPYFLTYYERDDGYGYWAAIAKAGGAFLGWFHLRPPDDDPDAVELGYRLGRAAWGQGYAAEGARALVRKGFTELGTRRIIARTLAAHTASIRVMEKAGLRFARRFVDDGPNAWRAGREVVEYALDRSEYRPDDEMAGEGDG